MKKKKWAEDFQGFIDLVNACWKSFIMDCKNYLLVPCGASHKTACEKQKLENVRVVMLKKGSDKIFGKQNTHKSSSMEHTFSKKIKSLGNDFKWSEQTHGVKTEKKKKNSFQLLVFFSSYLIVSFGKIFQSKMILLIYQSIGIRVIL